MISANGGLPAHRYTPQVTPRWPQGSEPASVERKFKLPSGGVLVLLSLSRHLRFGPNTAYSARLRVGICRGRNGRIMDESTQKRSDDTKIRQMTA